MRNKKSSKKEKKKLRKKSQKGSAKSRKKLSRSRDNIFFRAPKPSGKMIGQNVKMGNPNLVTYIPQIEDTMNKAATSIQALTRGRQSRQNIADMKSKWYKGFPGKVPKNPLNLFDISRITDMAIQGIDSEKERDRIQTQMQKITSRYNTELNKLNLDESKFNWGKYYSNKDINSIPTIKDRDLIRFEKKNYDKLKKIADKRKYWQEKLEKTGFASEYSRYNPNRVIDTPQFNIRSTAVDYLEDPEAKKQNYRDYYMGKYLDKDTGEYKFLEDYKMEDPPELSTISSNDTATYSTDDELLIPRGEVIEAVDYYKDMDKKTKNLDDKLENYVKKYDKQEFELEELLKLDIEKCLHAKKLAKADIKLYQNKDFMKNYYEPCSNNDNLTKIYIDTFYSLPWELINPASKTRFGQTIDDMIHHIPTTQWENGLITRDGQDILRRILRQKGLLIDPSYRYADLDNYIKYSNVSYSYGRESIATLLMLSNFYRWAVPGSVSLVHLTGKPTIYSNSSGRTLLEETFRMLDDDFKKHPEDFNGNVEKVKRFLILRLIGIIGNPDYPEILQNFINQHTQMINDRKVNLKHYKNELETNYRKVDDIIGKFTSEEISDKDRDRFIREYSNDLLAGLEDEDNERMYHYSEVIKKIKSDISKIENELPKLKKKLEIAERFSRITSTPKNYMTWEPEKLIYK